MGFMIRDRGNIKWTAMMLPEHVQSLREALIDENKIRKPELDEQTIEEFEMTILEAMEFNTPIVLEIFENGYKNSLKGTVHYINHLKSQLILQDEKGYFHHIPFNKLINIQPE